MATKPIKQNGGNTRGSGTSNTIKPPEETSLVYLCNNLHDQISKAFVALDPIQGNINTLTGIVPKDEPGGNPSRMGLIGGIADAVDRVQMLQKKIITLADSLQQQIGN